MQAECKQSAMPETETETETEAEKETETEPWSNDFDRWWSIYPKKVGKKPAQTIWKRINPDADVLIADIQERLARDDQWKRGYVPNPATYLNQERWTDELQQPKPDELTEADKYSISKRRTAAILQELNGGDVGFDVPALSSDMDSNEW